MTPRTMEERLFEVIQKDKNSLGEILDLSLDAPLFDIQHPKVVFAQMRFENSEILEETFAHPVWNAAFYSSSEEARRYHPVFQVLGKGSVNTFEEFIRHGNQSAVIDFPPLGTVALTQNDLEQGESSGPHRTTLPHWLTYALSPELWGPAGKWTRFHERLHTLFEKYQLLNGKDFPGLYPLKPEASWLQQKGFKGSLTDNQFILNLNWTFSLSALEKIESVIRER